VQPLGRLTPFVPITFGDGLRTFGETERSRGCNGLDWGRFGHELQVERHYS
jgi:hypothetical protein